MRGVTGFWMELRWRVPTGHKNMDEKEEKIKYIIQNLGKASFNHMFQSFNAQDVQSHHLLVAICRNVSQKRSQQFSSIRPSFLPGDGQERPCCTNSSGMLWP